MAEPDTAAQKPQIKMQILGQYIRDLSFENILAQKPVEGQVQPDVQVQVSLDARKRSVENQYDVIAKFNVTSKNKEGGESPFLLIECPRMLFPFIRRIISDVSRDGGFPPLNIDNIDFISLYRQTVAQRSQAAKDEGPGDPAKIN